MNNLNLGEKIKSFFKSLINSSNNYYLSFEPIGQRVNIDDFKLNDKVDVNLAREVTSKLTNFIPSADDFLGLGENLDEAYKILVESSQYAEPNGDQQINSDELSFFGQLRKEALLLPDEFSAAFSAANEKYVPVSVTPVDWYDPSKSANWKVHSFTVTQTVPTTGGGNPSGGTTGKPKDQLFNAWKLEPAVSKLPDSMANRKVFLAKDIQQKNAPALVPMSNLTKMVTLNGGMVNITAVPVAVDKTPNKGTVLNPSAISFPTTGTIISANTKILGTNVIATKTRGLETELNETPRSLEPPRSMMSCFKAVYLPQRTKLYREYFQTEAKPVTQEVQTQNFTISFNYCLVKIERNWFSRQFLKLNNWYAIGRRAGEYSNGIANDTKGEIPAIPSAFLVIKDLEITGNWETRDLAILNQVLGLGPFDLSEKSINNNKVLVSGMQIIGWVCEVLPFTPAKNDPNLAQA